MEHEFFGERDRSRRNGLHMEEYSDCGKGTKKVVNELYLQMYGIVCASIHDYLKRSLDEIHNFLIQVNFTILISTGATYFHLYYR